MYNVELRESVGRQLADASLLMRSGAPPCFLSSLDYSQWLIQPVRHEGFGRDFNRTTFS